MGPLNFGRQTEYLQAERKQFEVYVSQEYVLPTQQDLFNLPKVIIEEFSFRVSQTDSLKMFVLPLVIDYPNVFA